MANTSATIVNVQYDRNYTLTYRAKGGGADAAGDVDDGVEWRQRRQREHQRGGAERASTGSVTATAGTPQSAVVNTAFGTALQATVRDAGNNPVSGVTVTFTAPASGASARFGGIGDGDGDDQWQRRGDGPDADGEWDGGQLHRDGVGAGRGRRRPISA